MNHFHCMVLDIIRNPAFHAPGKFLRSNARETPGIVCPIYWNHRVWETISQTLRKFSSSHFFFLSNTHLSNFEVKNCFVINTFIFFLFNTHLFTYFFSCLLPQCCISFAKVISTASCETCSWICLMFLFDRLV